MNTSLEYPHPFEYAPTRLSGDFYLPLGPDDEGAFPVVVTIPRDRYPSSRPRYRSAVKCRYEKDDRSLSLITDDGLVVLGNLSAEEIIYGLRREGLTLDSLVECRKLSIFIVKRLMMSAVDEKHRKFKT